MKRSSLIWDKIVIYSLCVLCVFVAINFVFNTGPGIMLDSRLAKLAETNNMLCAEYLKNGQYPETYDVGDNGQSIYSKTGTSSYTIDQKSSYWFKSFEIRSNPSGVYYKTEEQDWKKANRHINEKCSSLGEPVLSSNR